MTFEHAGLAVLFVAISLLLLIGALLSKKFDDRPRLGIAAGIALMLVVLMMGGFVWLKVALLLTLAGFALRLGLLVLGERILEKMSTRMAEML